MKSTKLLIAIVASALTLTQSVYAAGEQAKPTRTQECINLNKQELYEIIKEAIAKAIEPKKPTLEHQIARGREDMDNFTYLKLKRNSNDIYSINLHVGDVLSISPPRYPAGFYWAADEMRPNPTTILQYLCNEYDYRATAAQPVDEYDRPLVGGNPFSMVFGCRRAGTTILKFNYMNTLGIEPTSQLLKITVEAPQMATHEPTVESPEIAPASEPVTSGTE